MTNVLIGNLQLGSLLKSGLEFELKGIIELSLNTHVSEILTLGRNMKSLQILNFDLLTILFYRSDQRYVLELLTVFEQHCIQVCWVN